MNNTDTIYTDNRNSLDNVVVVPVNLDVNDDGDWTDDIFEVTIYCRSLISSWQTFSVMVDYFENPVDEDGMQCEVPDNAYPESWPYKSGQSGFLPPYPVEEFDESDEADLSFPDGVGEIFLTDNSDLTGPGVNIDIDNEIYFTLVDEISGDYPQSVVFKNGDDVAAMITKDGSLILKGELKSEQPVLKNDPEELPPEQNTSVNIQDYEGTSAPWWELKPPPTPTPTPTATPTAIPWEPDNGIKEWVLRLSNDNVVALINLESGDMQIYGNVLPWNPIDFTDPKFVVRSGSEDVFVIDANGNLYMKGALLTNFTFQ